MGGSASNAAAVEAPVAKATEATARAVAVVALDRGFEEYDRTLSLGTLIVRNGSALWAEQMLP
jgi:hypothetical protein